MQIEHAAQTMNDVAEGVHRNQEMARTSSEVIEKVVNEIITVTQTNGSSEIFVG